MDYRLKVAVTSAVTAAALIGAAHAETIKFDTPACVTPFDLNEGLALYQAGRPVNRDTCVILRQGADVVRVNSFDSKIQIAYQQDGRTYSLFVRDAAIVGELTGAQLVNQDLDDRREAQQFAKGLNLDFYATEKVETLWLHARWCQRKMERGWEKDCSKDEAELKAKLAQYGK